MLANRRRHHSQQRQRKPGAPEASGTTRQSLATAADSGARRTPPLFASHSPRSGRAQAAPRWSGTDFGDFPAKLLTSAMDAPTAAKRCAAIRKPSSAAWFCGCSRPGVIRVTVGDRDTSDALLRVLRIEQIANEPDVTAAAALRASRTPSNHCPRSCTSTGDRRSSYIIYVRRPSRLVASVTAGSSGFRRAGEAVQNGERRARV